MRVTNSMLVSNLMRNLNSNLTRLDSLNNQLSTGRRFAHISDDPAALVYSQSARNKLARLSHYQRSIGTAQDWLNQTEAGVMELQDVLVDAYDAVMRAANDTLGDNETSDKRNVAQTVMQLREHFVDTLNTTFGSKFIFGGYNTPGDPSAGLDDRAYKAFTVEGDPPALFFNGFDLSQFDNMPAVLFHIDFGALDLSDPQNETDAKAIIQTAIDNMPPGSTFAADVDGLFEMHRLMSDVMTFDVGPGISIPGTFNGIELVLFPTPDENGNTVMRNAFNVLQDVYEATERGAPAEEINIFIKPLQDAQHHLLTKTAEVGGRVRRLDLLEARYEQDAINYERMRSDAEDVDAAEVIMNIKMAEVVYQAALSAGARIIQPTLMDFLR